MVKDLLKSPFPYFGGKQYAAPYVWAALGDVHHYVEPFCGSCAVLLWRPHPCNRPYHSETVNDADGLLCNALRAIKLQPDATAEAASNIVCEADLHVRHLWLLRWLQEHDVERLMADPDYCDPKAAGYWIWGICCWIGGEWCTGTGSWVVGKDGRITKREGREGGSPGVFFRRPHLTTGQGVNIPGTREPGVSIQRPHLSTSGQGVNIPGTREPGVSTKKPYISSGGRGVNQPGTREPGVSTHMPEYSWEEDDFHPMTMPELRRWFAFLSARLRHVRILNGDYKRLLTTGALKTLDVRMGKSIVGIFLDPPYSHSVRDPTLYKHDSLNIPTEVREWCLKNGDDPDYRIVLAGFVGEGHEILEEHGWRVVEWYKGGYLRGGYANIGNNGTKQHRERLWLSPHCLQLKDKEKELKDKEKELKDKEKEEALAEPVQLSLWDQVPD